METYTQTFEVFWKLYPKRRGKKRKKYPAWRSWLKLDAGTHHEILTKVKFVRQFEGDYPRDPVTWLNQRGWDDIEFKPAYVPVLPKELTHLIGKAEGPDGVDTNASRTRNLRLLKNG